MPIQTVDQKNLALEAQKKLLAGEIKARQQRNVVEAKAFSERLQAAVARYHANAITSLKMIQELIDMAKDVKAATQRGDDPGLSQEELEFHDALAENRSAMNVLGNEELRKIAQVLVEQLQQNVTVDWQRKECARAKLRVRVRRILKRCEYPPDLAPAAINLVLSQAETLLRRKAPWLAVSLGPAGGWRRAPPLARNPGWRDDPETPLHAGGYRLWLWIGGKRPSAAPPLTASSSWSASVSASSSSRRSS
ncbi:DUF3387 domain-containing protein [Poseidonocella sp. HB161398]|uniref:DUF3387 domain-containing protein n=1 Tax=Poseidonocella sp. HB161398 TaxID=2320855 RepID=UPI00110A01CB|nr:DUF3387 domain-containing protein [Poseidonocella sp. HB161398]